SLGDDLARADPIDANPRVDRDTRCTKALTQGRQHSAWMHDTLRGNPQTAADPSRRPWLELGYRGGIDLVHALAQARGNGPLLKLRQQRPLGTMRQQQAPRLIP